MKKSSNINKEYQKYIKNFTEYTKNDYALNNEEDYGKTRRFDDKIRK